ncbi:MAG: DUF2855 family protein [Xanthomonadales bacterium]|nr:DUF2855 family protein [Xanthomonadales bacterium]
MERYLDFQIRRENFAESRWVEADPLTEADLDDGQILVAVERFALTANNITYAVTGDSIGYWNFFPADDGWGRIPVWGFGTVTGSKSQAVESGERLYGFFPMSSQIVMTPAKNDPAGFFDATPERQGVASVYDYYRRCDADSDAHADDLRALFQPLFMTAFLLEDWLAEQENFGAERILMTSASSKTALGTAHLLQVHRDGDTPELIGTTSAGNRKFVESTGYFDVTVRYNQLESLPTEGPLLVIDYAGSRALKQRIRDHFDEVAGVVIVGVTHHGDTDLKPGAIDGETFFFAPDQSRKRVDEWGREGFQERYLAAAQRFFDTTGSWLELVHASAPRDLEDEFRDVLTGARDPSTGLILQF